MSAVTHSDMTIAADETVVFTRLNRVIQTVDECIPDRLDDRIRSGDDDELRRVMLAPDPELLMTI